MLLAVGPLEGPSHLVLGRLDPPVTQAGQGVAVALAGDDRAQDAHAGLPVTSQTALCSCTFICSSALCMRWIWREHDSTIPSR